MDPLRGVTEPVGRLAAALTRRGTYAGHLRELASTAITVGLWPLGVTEELLAPAPVAGRRVDDTPVLLIHGYGDLLSYLGCQLPAQPSTFISIDSTHTQTGAAMMALCAPVAASAGLVAAPSVTVQLHVRAEGGGGCTEGFPHP